jgi:hypothetical protein
MAKIIRRELTEILGGLSAMVALDEGYTATSPDDLFLCALGFEPRCLTLPTRLAAGGYRARRSAYFRYATNVDDNNVNAAELAKHLRVISRNVGPVDADAEDSRNHLRTLLESVAGEAADRPPSVVVDVSVMANRLLLLCMKALLEYDIRLRIVYSEAAVYHPTRQEYELEPATWEADDSFGLERGVREVVPSFDHPGHALDHLPDYLVLFPSLKPDRSKAVISFVDPSLLANPADKVAWLLGVPHLPEDRWRADAMKRINTIGADVPHYHVSTFDYKETLRILEHLHVAKSSRHTFSVSPLGSKMQALGTALFCYMHPDVRVIVSTPAEYNAVHYSEGCKAVWQVDFGDLGTLRKSLEDVGTLRVEE